ncbi:MAG: hypothetical protein IJ849_11005 [Selenomonadaceae bacterium]|nr:hypothetical protein [Selenomonadaceae bacterium]
MDVNTMTKVQSGLMMNAYQTGAATKTNANRAAAGQNSEAATEEKASEAFSVNISAEAQEAQEAAKKSKGLSADEVKALQQDIQEKSIQFMIDLMQANNDKLQGFLDNNTGKLRFGDVTIDTSRFGMPEVATTPEEAEAALAEGGEWSVNAVADRIFGLAEALAGGDPDKLEEMRKAVQDGFDQAGVAFKGVYGNNTKMPQITQDTYDEIMNRFDNRAKELSGEA